MKTLTLKGKSIVSGHCKGTALVTKKPISFLGGVEPNTGTIIEKSQDLEGKQLKNYVLCFSHGHGSTVPSNVDAKLKDEAEFGALGKYLGKLLNDKIPLLSGLSKYTNDDFKQLGATMATAGMTPIFKTKKPPKKTW